MQLLLKDISTNTNLRKKIEHMINPTLQLLKEKTITIEFPMSSKDEEFTLQGPTLSLVETYVLYGSTI